MHHLNFKFFLSLSVLSMLVGGCFDINDFVNFIPEEPPEPEKPYEPIDPGTIPDQDGGQTKPPGSGGITPVPDDQQPNENHPNGDTGNAGELVVPDTLELEFVNPAQGDVRGGYEVRVRGKALENGGIVQFGSLASPQQTYVNTNVVRAVVPAGRLGCVDVIWTQNGQSVRAEKAFCYTEKITVSDIQPRVFVAGTPTPVTLHGSGFDSTSVAYFGKQMVTPIESQLVSSHTMTGILAFDQPGEPTLHIANTSSYAEFDGLIDVLPSLAIDRISPPFVKAGEQAQIVIEGSGFDANVHLRVGHMEVVASDVTEHQVIFNAPNLSPGSYDILIYDDYRQQRMEAALHYISADDTLPLTMTVSPQYGQHLGGDIVTIVGHRLPLTGEVTFGGKAAEVMERSEYAWTVKTPAGTGVVDITLGDEILNDAFEYFVKPQATTISPEHASYREDLFTILTGSDFTKDLRVKFGAFESPNVTIQSSTEALVQVPQGSGQVGLTLTQGKVQNQTNLTFTYDVIPQISGILPTQAVILGGTTIEIYGQGFMNGMTLWLDGQKIEDLNVHAANYMTFTAPAHDAGKVELELKDIDGNVLAQTTLTYFNPSGINTSASGGPIQGQLHVTVLTVDTAVPIPNATVYVGSDLATARKRVTDANGRTSFFNDEIVGAQTIIACAPEHSCNTLQPVNASQVTLFLEDWHANETDDELPPLPPPPEDGEMINPIDVTVPYTPKPAYFTGTVGGFGKVDLVSDPNLVRAAIVAQSMLSPYAPSYYQDDVYLLFNEGDTYRIRARSGDVALSLICGLYNTQTTEFTPKYIGVKRNQMVTDGAEIVNHLECPLPLNQTQGIKLLDAPLNSGPNVVVANAYLFMGNEGYIGGFMNGKSETDLVVITRMPPLRAELAEAKYAIAAGAYTDMGYPASVFYEYGVTPQSDPIEVGPAVPIPILLTPSTEDVLATGRIAWKVEHPENVDFYEMKMRMYSSQGSQLLWQFYMPGTATTAEFPLIHQWPEDMSGQLYIQLTAYKSIREGFDFNLFSTGDLRHNYIHSSAYTTLFIRDPKKEQP